MARPLQPCGTPAAHARHRRQGEAPCEPCREAWNAYLRTRRTGVDRGPRELQPCGTTGAYQRHLRADEEPCEACKDAWQRTYRALQRAYRALARRYPADFQALLTEARADEGL